MVERVAVLYSELAGYTVACLRALQERYGVELLVYRWPVAGEAPFDERLLSGAGTVHTKPESGSEAITTTLARFDPQAVLMSGWMDRDYLRVARRFRARGVPVIAGSDTPWKGTLRQHAARLAARRYLHPAIDVLWVTGERQRRLAARLGYRGDRCWSGFYACDWARFARAEPPADPAPAPFFLYVGRYHEVKGIDLLIKAYRQYRQRVPDPWPLHCVGTGPLNGLLDGQEGIVDRGFVQPDRLPEVMHEAAAFVLPSRREPWGVVVQEAAAAGLPLVCTDAAGAGVHLLQDGYNGFLVEAGNVDHLTGALGRMTALDVDERHRMGRRSHELSKPFTPQRWAATLIDGLGRLDRS